MKNYNPLIQLYFIGGVYSIVSMYKNKLPFLYKLPITNIISVVQTKLIFVFCIPFFTAAFFTGYFTFLYLEYFHK